MAAGVPPPPLNSPSGSYYWLEWYTNLTNFLNGTNIPWSNLNFTGSNLTDIQTRNHNDLQNIQGGDATHHYHASGFGYVDATATSVRLPSGWTAVRNSAGTYTITHGLSYTSPDYMAMGTSNTAGVAVQSVTLASATTVVVHTANAAGTATDAAFTVWIGTL